MSKRTKIKITTSQGMFYLRTDRGKIICGTLEQAIQEAHNSLVDRHYLVMQGYTNNNVVLSA